ncbi:hypothetical protein BUALT_Bualt01G0065000 [Buddleja alternifolia]|uniref:Pectinesterase inhibitor domain-containing protein n=1 Tax=Buddleja alternifolia TaxID=168488 RepID=A0AAV6Y6B9_9LAMI|nr:hypothetical protein BUALT_Bualt01G0065000 [Buddleja alternifolia]
MINPTSAASRTPDNTNTYFIKKSCNTTTYSSLCTKTLTPYASAVGTSPVKLCNAALTVAVQATTNCSTAVSKLSNQKDLTRPDARAIKDCIGDLKDAVYELKQTVNAMKHLGDSDREFEWANAKTYASAAITDAETCVDEKLVNGSAKKKIKSCVSVFTGGGGASISGGSGGFNFRWRRWLRFSAEVVASIPGGEGRFDFSAKVVASISSGGGGFDFRRMWWLQFPAEIGGGCRE